MVVVDAAVGAVAAEAVVTEVADDHHTEEAGVRTAAVAEATGEEAVAGEILMIASLTASLLFSHSSMLCINR